MTVQAKELLAALRLAKRHCDFKSDLEILKHCKIEISNGILTLSTTNLDTCFFTELNIADHNLKLTCIMDISAAIEYLIKKRGTVSILLMSNSKNNPNNYRLMTDIDSDYYEFVYIDPNMWPVTPSSVHNMGYPETATYKHTTPVDKLYTALSVVAPCASTEETRYYLNGVYFEGSNIVAADDHRLALYSMSDYWSDFPASIIPMITIKSLIACLKIEKTAYITLTRQGYKIMFEFGNTTIVTKLVDGAFPDWKRVIPKPCNVFSATITRKNIDLVTNNRAGRHIQAVFCPKTQTLTTKTFNGNDQTKQPIDCTGNTPFGFNMGYLKSFFQNSCDQIRLEGETPTDPFIITTGTSNFTGVIMPLRF